MSEVKEIMAGINEICITTDLWTSNKQDSYISITAHWLEDSFVMQHGELATHEMPESYTGVNIKDRIEQCLRNFVIEKFGGGIHGGQRIKCCVRPG